MFKRTTQNEGIDSHQDVSALTESLDALLRSYDNRGAEEIDAARARASKLLRQTRARLNGNSRVTQAAKDAGEQVASYVHNKPWHGIGIGTAFGIFIGALLVSSTGRN
ncbi:hypothetical protein BL250_13365 [Erwinia sp. OLTSP20]|uniref:DUF883 family protein n=1 Tax=unclassified Erwinia TaxID=2622719 RepID=UPI000C17C5AC|nr:MULTISPECIES: DUF883 family protein [unclassified Erwinia]PIJ49155.1 hypothetical protein BV501_13935 [Erwinia sp. OAMSP11]PIJ70455.1 hypothetical protein BK416_13435 [Erwinia sp. OLSSP12]PIJ79948.1 hypothetical protein BLD47_12370 [Erwinia sp. OLCASP19]PIJ81310.1 hypothetical protein BLD46_12825 [Erwinia sp. OLMTSP26]PIJ83875.1 hypothetical protein BLD49_12765 [Erwinia sp. OLMDSP33]